MSIVDTSAKGLGPSKALFNYTNSASDRKFKTREC